MDEDVKAQATFDQHQRSGDEFTALFAQLDRHDAVASFEGGLIRLVETIHRSRRDCDRH